MKEQKSLIGFIDPNFINTSLGFKNTFMRIKPPIDARDWAKEFMRLYWEKNPKQFHYIDENLMIGWFANAIMAGYDKAKRESSKPSVPSRADIRKVFDEFVEVGDNQLKMLYANDMADKYTDKIHNLLTGGK